MLVVSQGNFPAWPWGLLPGLCPGPVGDLKQSPDPSPTFVLPNTKTWIGTTRSGTSYRLRDIYSICMCLLNGAHINGKFTF